MRLSTAICLLAAALPAPAQRVTSDILGVVTDPSGGRIQGATVTVNALETGAQRTVTTDDEGGYLVAGVAAGRFKLRVDKAGFAQTVVRDIEVLVNDRVVVDVAMQLEGIKTQFEVQSNPQLIETTTSHLSGVVGESALRELPLNGRDLFQLTLLQTGVLPSTNAGPNPWAEGGIGKASVQGARPTMNNVNLDGADINDPGFNIPPGGTTGTQMGVEAVREFRVLLNNYSAEFGRNAGGNIQLITKSGTNELHGSLFEFFRNAALDARNFFDGAGTPPFVRNQFGAATGGPIVKNRTFYFANFETLLENKSVTASLTVPDSNAHLGLLPSASGSGLVNVGVDPRIGPFLALYPQANGPEAGGGLATLNTSRRQPTRADYGLIRIDHRISDRDDFFARYAVDDSSSTVPFLSTLTPGFPGQRVVRNQYGILNWQRVLTPNLLNEAKFGYTRVNYQASSDNQYPLSISLLPNRALGVINVTSLPAIGNNVAFPFGTTSNVYELIDNAMYHHGRHDLKVGGNFKRYQINGPFDLFATGEYVFTDLTPFGFAAQSTNPSLEFFLRGTPLVYLGVDPQLSDSTRGFRQSYLGLYANDDIRVGRNLVVNLGIRWEYYGIPGEANGRTANIRNVLTDKAPTPGPIWAGTPLDQWSPRAGFAWTPKQGGKTVIRGGFGLMRDQIWANIYFDVRFYEPYYRALEYTLPTFTPSPSGVGAIVGSGGPPAVIGSAGITYRPDFPYYLQYNLNVQREIAPNLLLQVAYVGSRGIHLIRGGEANPFSPSLGMRPNPNFGSLPLIVTDAQSSYNSGQLSLQKRLSGGLHLQASYTYSKSIDDQSGAFPSDFDSESGFAQNLADRKGDRGRSSFDRTHAFVVNSLYALPFGPGHHWGAQASGIAWLLRDWTAGGVLAMYSGAPFTATLGSFNNSGSLGQIVADRSDLRPGVNVCGNNTGSPNQWYDTKMFALPAPGAYGNAGRNILCGPAFMNLDFSVSRQFHLTERIQLQFRTEIFNLFNHANFDVPINTQGPSGNGGNGDGVFLGRRATLANGTPCTAANDPLNLGCGVLAPNAGQIFKTVTPSRQIQFGLKVTF